MITANEARDLTRNGRVTLVKIDDGDWSLYRVDLDGWPVGFVQHRDRIGWCAIAPKDGRPEIVDTHRSRRHAAVRRLLMATIDQETASAQH